MCQVNQGYSLSDAQRAALKMPIYAYEGGIMSADQIADCLEGLEDEGIEINRLACGGAYVADVTNALECHRARLESDITLDRVGGVSDMKGNWLSGITEVFQRASNAIARLGCSPN